MVRANEGVTTAAELVTKYHKNAQFNLGLSRTSTQS